MSDSFAEAGTPAAPDSTSAAPAAPDSTPSSQTTFAQDLAAANPTLTQADLDAKVAEARSEWEKSYPWATKYNADQVKQWEGFIERLSQDRFGTALALMREDPAALNAFVRQVLAESPRGADPASPAAPAAAAAPEPQPDLRVRHPETGEVVSVYSAAQQAKWLEWHKATIKTELSEQIKPLTEFRDQSLKAAQMNQQYADQMRDVQTIAAEIQGLPKFKDYEKEIAAEIAKEPLRPGQNLGQKAYQAYVTVVMGKMTAENTSEALASHARRAAASTARPTGSHPATPASQPTTFAEDLRAEFARRKAVG